MTEKELMLTSILNCTRSELYLKERTLNTKQKDRLNYLAEQRKEGFPLQYLLGYTEFMGLKFCVDKRVLIPRFLTEILAEEIIKLIKDSNLEIKSILDIGTGTGNIAISLVKFLHSAKADAIDISAEALKVAKKNAFLNNVNERINFSKADMLNNRLFSRPYKSYDLIVSNPPYVRTADLSKLSREVKQEPKIALDAGEDGLKYFRRIIRIAPGLLKKQGLLAFEIGEGQSQEIIKLLENRNKFRLLELVEDYAGIVRGIIARLN